MTIVYIINQLRKSGPVEVLYNLVKNLHRFSVTPVIIRMMEDDTDRSITPAFKELGIEVLEFSYSFIDLELRTRWVAQSLEQLFVGRKVDLIHTHGYHPVLVASYMHLDCPKIETMHCICQEDFVSSKGKILGTYMNWRYLRHLKRLDAGVAISETGKMFYEKKLGGFSVLRIYNGVDVSKFNIREGVPQREWREKLDLPKDYIIFVVVGTVRKIKDPRTVIKAFLGLPDNIRERSLLLFLGKGNLLEECKQLAKGCPSIVFKGYTFNVDEYLKAADYAICASRSEGFGLSCVEALMTGVPVIASDIGPFREFTAGYPELQNLHFPVGRVDLLRDKMKYAFGHPIEIIAVANEIRDRFSTDRMVGNYVKLYQSLKK